MLIFKLILIWFGAFALITTQGLDYLFFALAAGGVLTAISIELEGVKKKLAESRDVPQKQEDVSRDAVLEPQREALTASLQVAPLGAVAMQQQSPQQGAEAPATQEHVPAQEKPSFSYEEFFGKKFFGALGVVSLVGALAFFTVWAFEHNLIGPRGRIALGIIVSLVFIIAGELLRSRFQKSYLLLTAIGIGGLLAVSFVARAFYGFISPSVALGAYIVEVGAGAFLSLRYNSRILGSFSTIGGLIAPVFIKPPEPNPEGLLLYLAILSLAAFIIALYKNWYEILGVLFIGVTIFEVSIFGLMMDKPLALLLFIAVLHLVPALGGIIRILKDKIKQAVPTTINQLSHQESFEIAVFTISLVVGNTIAWRVFKVQGWEHFGFVLLGQGFVFYLASELLKRREILFFRIILFGLTLLSITLAIPFEVGLDNEPMLTLAWLLESVLFSVIGFALRDKTFSFFSKVSLLLAWFALFNIERMLYVNILMAFLLIAFALSQLTYEWEKGAKQWLYLSVVLSSTSVFYWSFFRLIEALPKEALSVSFAVAGVWGIVLAVTPLIFPRYFSRLPSLLYLAVYNLQFWRYVSEGGRYYGYYGHSGPSYPLLSFAVVLVVIGVVFATYFKRDETVSQEFRKNAVIGILALASVTVLMYGVQILRDPSRSIYWTVYGALLFLLGLYKNDKYARGFGIGALVFVIGKIYIIDVWRWETWIRVVALAVLGVALIVVSFVYQKKFKFKEGK